MKMILSKLFSRKGENLIIFFIAAIVLQIVILSLVYNWQSSLSWAEYLPASIEHVLMSTVKVILIFAMYYVYIAFNNNSSMEAGSVFSLLVIIGLLALVVDLVQLILKGHIFYQFQILNFFVIKLFSKEQATDFVFQWSDLAFWLLSIFCLNSFAKMKYNALIALGAMILFAVIIGNYSMGFAKMILDGVD